jgi:hypothetical protein
MTAHGRRRCYNPDFCHPDPAKRARDLLFASFPDIQYLISVFDQRAPAPCPAEGNCNGKPEH